MKKTVTMQDISCIGKCSLTAALPVLSTLGIEAIPLPTAVLSTHTMFKSPHIHDLTDQILPIMDHWKKEGFVFDSICTGYLASLKQIEIAKTLFETFPVSLKVVDPCMADHGKLYSGFDMTFVEHMKSLCACADVICPNMSEACLLLGIPYEENPDEKTVRDILRQLSSFGCKTAIITGIGFEENTTGAYAYNSQTRMFSFYSNEKEAQSFHGTGDLWAACLTGCLTSGFDFHQSLQISCDFVKDAIHKTLSSPNHNTYGTDFEASLNTLRDLLNEAEKNRI